MTTHRNWNLLVTLLAGFAVSSCDDDSTSAPTLPAFDPVPDAAKGPAIPPAGYLVQEVKDKLYWVSDGIYSCMFLSTGVGVIVVDAPQTIAPNLLAAIASVTSEPITHVVYSHHHADHIGGAGVLPKEAITIAQASTAALLRREADPNRPIPTVTFDDTYTLSVGTQTLILDYKGPNHDVGNIFIYAPSQKVLMLVDVVWPGWAPFDELGSPVDIRGYLDAHEQALAYGFDTLIAGHVNRLGTRNDVTTDAQFIADLEANAAAALQAFDPTSVFGELSDPTNVWAYGSLLLAGWPGKCVTRRFRPSELRGHAERVAGGRLAIERRPRTGNASRVVGAAAGRQRAQGWRRRSAGLSDQVSMMLRLSRAAPLEAQPQAAQPQSSIAPPGRDRSTSSVTTRTRSPTSLRRLTRAPTPSSPT
jgi:glyoxylase-like metal-dependent hydrolase (beta-lactamase superfamily II)